MEYHSLINKDTIQSSSAKDEPCVKRRKTAHVDDQGNNVVDEIASHADDFEADDLEEPLADPDEPLLDSLIPGVISISSDVIESDHKRQWTIPPLSVQDELVVMDFLQTCALFDIPQTRAGLRPALQAAANCKGINCLFGDHWMQQFLQRHPQIGRIRNEARDRRLSPTWSTGHFSSFLRLLSALHERCYLLDAQRVIYADFSMLLIGGNQMKMSFEEGGPAYGVSVLSFGAASGGVLKPLLISDKELINEEDWDLPPDDEPKRKPIKKKLTPASSSKFKKGNSDASEENVDFPITQAVFNAYILNELIPYLNSLPADTSCKNVLYLNRGFWHLMTDSLLNVALENDIVVVPIAPGVQMDLKPWEVYDFSPIRWDQRISFKDAKFTLQLLRLHGFARHLWEVAVQCYYDRNLPAEFSRLGLFPYPPSLETLIASGMPRKTRYLYGSFVEVDRNMGWFKEVHEKLLRRFGITNEEAALALQGVIDSTNEILSARNSGEVVARVENGDD
ncbi:uncharacterized protein LOC129584025 [Paramacrobiotus metropolitanus]|uniref:uncharacterized protein LOC129584025 n=1 Tax=Paramacrobiotus metropolitanus TaxID=2943436 RepID=UPI002445BBD2|nr:uncharacterized protein LOC129584025 [Paramacrobiotus metropolitanus]